MNFLGHLYFSFDNVELQYANIFGDFVKGSRLDHYPNRVEKGIRLHREIDHFIDTNEGVRKLLKQLYPKLPHVSGIAVDLYFDHLLAKNWSRFHPLSLEDFIRRFNDFELEDSTIFTHDYLFVLRKMREEQWLLHYREHSGLIAACEGLSRRIKFENNLGDAPEILKQMEPEISRCFEQYMKEAMAYFKPFVTKLLID